MLEIQIGKEKFKLDVITVRKLNQTIAFKTKFEILQAQGNKEMEIIEAMIEYLVDIFSIKKGEEVKYLFDKDYILDNMPLNELQDNFDFVINGVLSVFSNGITEKN